MSFQNIFYDYKFNSIHLWEDSGYTVFPYDKYAYVKTKDNSSPFKTIFGVPVKKVSVAPIEKDYHRYFELDVDPQIRTLIDIYGEDTSLSKNNRIYVLDIEVETTKKGNARPDNPINRVTAITIINLRNKSEKYTLLLDESGRFTAKNEFPFVECFHTEEQLLKRFIVKWREISPTIITGWNIDGYDIPYLYRRIKNKFADKDLSEKLSPINIVRDNDKRVRIAGVSSMDYILLYKKLTQKTRPSYSLDYISKVELKKQKVKFKGSLQKLYDTDINKYVEYNLTDVELVIELDEKLGYIEKARGLAHMAHVPYEAVLSAVQVTEGLFLTTTKKMNLVCPNKPSSFENYEFEMIDTVDDDDDDDDKIVGAYVKPPRGGRFKYTYDLDLTSLYPMIAVTLNISPETKFAKIRDYIKVWQFQGHTQFSIDKEFIRHDLEIPDYDSPLDLIIDILDGTNRSIRINSYRELYSFCITNNLTISGNGVLYKKDIQGIIPTIIKDIFDGRVKNKKLRDEAKRVGNKDLESYYDNVQWRLKIVMNSIYGVMSNQYFRFYDKDNAQSITMTGRYTTLSGMDTVFQTHRKIKKYLDDSGITYSPRMGELLEDPILAGDTDSIIMSAEPLLFYKYNTEYFSEEKQDEYLSFVLKSSQKLRNIVNERMEFFGKYWLNSDDCRLRFKEEWIAESGFYSGFKKRYANKILMEEGVKVKPHIDVKGLDTVRSSFPKSCQDFLVGMLERILSERDSEMNKYVLDFYDELRSKGEDEAESIGNITGVKNIVKYSDKFGSPLKGTPIHVKSVLNFNSFIRINELQEYIRPISDGDKVWWVYLQPNSYNFDSFAVQLDEFIPEIISDFISDYVDVDKTIHSLLDKKIEKYYNAMGWTLPSTKQNTLEDIFGIDFN